MASDTAGSYQPPMVEDYNSDDSEVLSKNFPRKASPSAQANVKTKRSEDLTTDQPPAQQKTQPADLRSDSGYSSYTAASKSSADSAQSQRSPPVVAPAVVSSSPAPRPRRPTVDAQRQPGTDESPRRNKISRNASVSSKRPPNLRRGTITREPYQEPECTDPNCEECGPNATKRALPPTASAAEFANYSSDQASQRSDPNPYFNPPSPTYTRNQYPQGPVVMQPSTSRRRSSSTVRVRPQSFAAPDPGANYWVPPTPTGYPSPPQERGPPVSYNHYMPYMGQQAQAPHPSAFYPAQTHQTSPPYEQQRPRLQARESSNYTRPFPAPIITQAPLNGEPSKYSARFGRQQEQPPTPNEFKGRSQARLTQAPHEDDSSSGESDDYEEYDARHSRTVARALMPPPALPEPKRSKSRRRPTLTQTNTAPTIVDHREYRRATPVSDERPDRRRQSIVIPERPKAQDRSDRASDRLARMNTAPQPRRQSMSRPQLQRVAQSEYNTRDARVFVNNSKSGRRQSYQGQAYDQAVRQAIEEQQKRERRASRVIVEDRHMPGEFLDDESEEEVRAPLARPRRKTDAGRAKERSDTKNRKAENAAEEYINSTRGSRAPVADVVNKAAKRGSRIIQHQPDSGSSHSSGSGKQSISQRTNATNGNNEIRLRVDSAKPIALSFNGDMEGRTLQLLPAGDGLTEVVIGNRDTVYHSERGSVAGNRRSLIASQPRREAEDMISERSTRSAPRSRRERDEIRANRDGQDERGHVLRRSRHTTYYQN